MFCLPAPSTAQIGLFDKTILKLFESLFSYPLFSLVGGSSSLYWFAWSCWNCLCGYDGYFYLPADIYCGSQCCNHIVDRCKIFNYYFLFRYYWIKNILFTAFPFRPVERTRKFTFFKLRQWHIERCMSQIATRFTVYRRLGISSTSSDYVAYSIVRCATLYLLNIIILWSVAASFWNKAHCFVYNAPLHFSVSKMHGYQQNFRISRTLGFSYFAVRR